MRGEFLDLGGARVYYYAAGTRGAGNPVVLIHGFPTSSHLWNDVVPLMPPGHRIVVLDLLGYGRSDRPGTRDVGIAAHAARIVAVLDELRIPAACLVGHGMGGGIAQLVAAEHSSRVSHLCLVDTIALGDNAWIHAGISRAALPVVDLLPPSGLIALLRRDLLRRYDDPARAARSVDLYLRPFAGADGRATLVAHLRAGRRPSNGVDGRIGVPTALVWGAQDRVMPRRIGEHLQSTIPRATMMEIPGARHFTPEEAPREVADAIAALLREEESGRRELESGAET